MSLFNLNDEYCLDPQALQNRKFPLDYLIKWLLRCQRMWGFHDTELVISEKLFEACKEQAGIWKWNCEKEFEIYGPYVVVKVIKSETGV